MQISEIKYTKISLCRGDLKTLIKGEALRFQFNGMDFELVGSVAQAEPEIIEAAPAIAKLAKEVEKPGIKKTGLSTRAKGREVRKIFSQSFEELPSSFGMDEFRSKAEAKGIQKYLTSAGSFKVVSGRYVSAWLKEGKITKIKGKPGWYKKAAAQPRAEEDLPENFRNFKKSHRSGDTVQCSTKGLVDYAECRGCQHRVREEGDLIFCDLKIHTKGA